MKSYHEGRIARTARFLAARLESESEVRLTIPSEYAYTKIFRIMCYLNQYCGKYWIESPDSHTGIVRKWG